MAEKVGKKTGQTTEAGRPVYKTPDGELVSEKSATIKLGNKYINVPSIHDGVMYSEDELLQMLKENKIEATSVHDSVEEAVQAAKERSTNLLAKGGSMESQMEMFEEGGLKDEGGTIDPISGNDVPSGSTQEEVRDDIPAQLSEGEFVFPADVVRYIGLENLMQLRQKAKQGLAKMDAMGQMGNSEEATMSDDGEYEAEVDQMIEEMDMEQGFAEGGVVMAQQGALIPGQAPTIPSLAPSAPRLPTYTQFMQQPVKSPVVYGTDQYIGPAGDIIGVTTINGQPIGNIPEGYRKYNPAVDKPAEPKVAEPTVQQGSQEDSSDDRERSEASKKEYTGYLTEISTLSELSPEFKEWAEKNIPGQVKAAKAMTIDPMTGEVSFPGMSFGEQLKGALGGEKFKELAEGLKGLTGENAYEKAYSSIADSLNIDLDLYKQEGIFGTTQFDKDRFIKDVKEYSSLSAEEQRDRQNTADKYNTNPVSEQTKMLAEQDKDFGPEYDVETSSSISRSQTKTSEEDADSEDNSPTGSNFNPGFDTGDTGDIADQLGDSYEEPDDPSYDDRTTFKRGGLASPKPTKPKRKPTMKRGGLASKK